MRLARRAQVRVLEASDRLGGQIWSEYSDGFLVERGAEGFVARSELVPKLVRDLGLGDDALIEQSVTRSYGFERGALKLLQPGEAASLLGFQVPPEELGRGIRSLRRGMGSLIDALVAHLDGRASLTRCALVTALERRASALVVHTRDAGSFDADAVVIATSSVHASALLQATAPQASALATAPTLSSVNVEFVFARDQVQHPLDATGFVVAHAEQEHGVRACAFTSSKFAERAPSGFASLRVFMRPSAVELASLDEQAWRERALAGLMRVLPVEGAPLRSWVSSWPNALPVFSDAHRSAVQALEAALPAHQVLLAGSAFHGAGIDAAVRSAERAAAILLAQHDASG
jgi:oxygen-dependent protoporphyrinogen oxidase